MNSRPTLFLGALVAALLGTAIVLWPAAETLTHPRALLPPASSASSAPFILCPLIAGPLLHGFFRD